MRIAFVHCLYESLGLEYISAELKKRGHETCLFFDPLLFDNYLVKNKFLDRMVSYKERLVDNIAEYSPDIVGFSVLTDNYLWCCDMAKRIKNRLDTLIVFGGVHPTAVPERVLKKDYVDFVICGEGEKAMAELAGCLSSKRSFENLPNIGYKNGSRLMVNEIEKQLTVVDSELFPDKNLFYNEYKHLISDAYMIVTSRGCFYKCSYCCENLMDKVYGRYHRRRTPDNVLSELLWAKKRYGIKKVNFQDSIFTYDPHWLDSFLPKYKEKVGLPFFCFVYPSAALNEELIGKLADAGCSTVNMGIQSVDEKLRKNVFLRHESDADIASAIRAIKSKKVYLYLDFVLFPTVAEPEMVRTLQFCFESGADFIAVSWLIYYPGTEIIKISKELSILDDNDIEQIEEGTNLMPYFDKSEPRVRVVSRIANFMYLSGILPEIVKRVVLHLKLYRFITYRSLFLPLILFVGLKKQLFDRKSPFSYSSVLSFFTKYYCDYIKRKCLV